MTQSTMSRAQLEDLVRRFTEAFNKDDLDGVMSFMAEDAVYDEFNGKINHGKAAIRAAFEPQFRGAYGVLRFHTEDLFVDAATGKALIRWLCTLERNGHRRGWRGLDILHFENGRLQEKLTYAKAEVPLLRPQPEQGEVAPGRQGRAVSVAYRCILRAKRV
jgi:ketosteroid isomerase-like protein